MTQYPMREWDKAEAACASVAEATSILREPFPVLLALIAVAKTARWLGVAGLTLD